MAFLIETIKAVRNIRMEVNAPMSSKIDIMIQLDDAKDKHILDENADYVENFLHPKKLEVAEKLKLQNWLRLQLFQAHKSLFH